MTSNYNRSTRFENLEPRLVMSAQALTDFVADLQTLDNPAMEVDIDQRIETLTQSGGGENYNTDIASIREQYNLSGNGQTIAVIDSGIAFDHLALGGGFGEDYRVVGGYDFAENDANPYDDGPLGLHGTHVAGIIGGSSDEFAGVAPEVDLVSLRVFDDNGAGELAWVEQALQWVHENRNAFENPITTVNLSVGTNWNADVIPEAAELEDEFAQLEADGIFVSVAAGNLFSSFNEAGVSYPAASPFVVPVASHDVDGEISDFSQRNDRVLVAPGESILSTVPDHIFAGSQTDGYLRSSGTSQSAPFVAGASALLREAFENAGHTGIDQDMLYEHFRETADLIHDQATGASYHRINLARAIEAAVGDDHGNNQSTATNAGVLNGGELIRGVIEHGQDFDHFRFSAGETGQVTFTVNANGNLNPSLGIANSAHQSGNQISFDVVRGEEYVFSVGSSSGTGGYEIGVSITNHTPTAPVYVDNGRLIVNGTAGNDHVDFNYGSSVNVTLNGQEFNFQRSAINDVLIIGGSGTDSITTNLDDVDRAVLRSGRVDAYGDNIEITARGFEAIDVIGGSDSGRLIVYDAAGNDTFNAGFDVITISGSGYANTAAGFEKVSIVANRDGFDRITLTGTTGDDRFLADNDRNVLRSGDQRIAAVGFEHTMVLGRGGDDFATIRDSIGNDRFVLEENRFSLDANHYQVHGYGFERSVAVSRDGYDVVTFEGGEAEERFIHRTGRSRLASDGYLNVANNFDKLHVHVTGQDDSARIYDSSGNDSFETTGNSARYEGGGQILRTNGFSRVDVFAELGGYDTVELTGTSGNDQLYSSNAAATLFNASGSAFHVKGFDRVNVDTGLGFDTANLVGSDQQDLLKSLDNGIEHRSVNQRIQVLNAENNEFDGRGGVDEAVFSNFGELDLLEGLGDGATAFINSQKIIVSDIELLEASTRQSESSQHDIAAVDYLFLLDGNWQQLSDDGA